MLYIEYTYICYIYEKYKRNMKLNGQSVSNINSKHFEKQITNQIEKFWYYPFVSYVYVQKPTEATK